MCQKDKIKAPRRWQRAALAVQAGWLLFSTASTASPNQNTYSNQVILPQARKLFSAGHVIEARRLVEPLCNQPDSTAEMYCLLAETYIDDNSNDRQDSTKIEANLRLALKADPLCSHAYKNWAEYCNIQGDYKKAIDYSTKSLSCPRPYTRVYRQRIIAYSNLGQYEKALADMNTFIGLGKPEAESYIMKAGLLEKMKRYDEAVVIYRRAFAMQHQDMTLYSITRCLQMQHKYIDAIREISLLIKMNPGDSEALAVRAQLQMSNKNLAAAVEDYSRAIDMDPSTRLYKARAALHLLLGQKQAAEADLVSAKKLEANQF